jgi:hypothetical protein
VSAVAVAPVLAMLVALGADEILLPPWPLGPDGEIVGVRGEATLVADGGRAERWGPGLWRVVPAEGARDVVLAAGAARARAEVERPGSIEIRAEPAEPVKGRDGAVRLSLLVLDAAGQPDPSGPPPRLAASAGELGALAAEGPGRFAAVLDLPRSRHPELAVLVASVPRCPLCPTPRAAGLAILPIASAIDLPGRSEPEASLTVEVGGRTFGPVRADAAGRFAVPVVLPPGVAVARATAVDARGNARVVEVPIPVVAPDRLACLAWPEVLPADGESEARVLCGAAEPDGRPSPAEPLEARAGRGEVRGPAPFGEALRLLPYRAPRGGGGGEDDVDVRLAGGGGARTLRIALARGPPAAIEARVLREPVPAGSSAPAESAVRDARGDLLGRPEGPPGATDGFVAPDRFVARREPPGGIQEARLLFALGPGREAATLALSREGEHWVARARTVDGRPASGVPLRFGSGAEAATDARGEARAPARGEAETVHGPLGLRAAGWAGLEPPPAPFAVERTVAVAVAPPLAVDVAAWVADGFVRWRIEDPPGTARPGRRVLLRSSGVSLGPPEPDGAGGRARIAGGSGTIAVVDAETGVAAVVEVP